MVKEAKDLKCYRYEYEEWSEGYAPRQTVNNHYMSEIQDLSKYFVEKGYSKKGTEKICGQTCDVYSGTLTERLNVAAYSNLTHSKGTGEIAVWYSYILRYLYMLVFLTVLEKLSKIKSNRTIVQKAYK